MNYTYLKIIVGISLICGLSACRKANDPAPTVFPLSSENGKTAVPPINTSDHNTPPASSEIRKTAVPPNNTSDHSTPPVSPGIGKTVVPANNTSDHSTPPADTADFKEGFGIDYCGDDLAACADLGATWSRHTGVATLAYAKESLDEAQALNMRLILRMNQGDWGWDGRQFDLSILEVMRPIFDHPALIGFYGLHEPLERFTVDEMRIFYRQFREMVDDSSILLWHDIMRIPDDFTDGICDLCGVATNPHVNHPETGEPINDWKRTDPRLSEAILNMGNSSQSTLCVLVQVYGGDGRYFLRMPQPTEYQENLRRIVEVYGIRCIANYAYHHNAYEQTLGDPDQLPLQTAVQEIGQRYFRQ